MWAYTFVNSLEKYAPTPLEIFSEEKPFKGSLKFHRFCNSTL